MEYNEYTYARKLLDVVSHKRVKMFTFFLTAVERDDLFKACLNITTVIDWNFKFLNFYETLSNFCYTPLEFLWNLHILQIMPLEAYISNIYEKKEMLEEFKGSIISLCAQDFVENDVQDLIQNGFLSYFVRKAFPAVDALNADEKIKEICLVTLKGFLQGIFSTEEKEIKSKRLGCFFSLWNAGILEETTLDNFCFFAVDFYLKFYPAENDLNAFEIFENLNSTSDPYHLLHIIEKLLKSQKFERISHILTSIIRKTGSNAKRLLVTVRAVLETHKEASSFLRKFVLESMNEAYENLNYNLLLKLLLIGRQVAFHPNIQLHICYKHWLQNVFNDYGHLKNIESFLLLLQVLTDLVPLYKNIECLKVAIELDVHVPQEARPMYDDYIVLLKTRVQDLKPQSKPEETVERVLSLYQILGKIPPVIMEASLLQKNKYLHEFLPVLLTPRLIPEILDVQERFIDALDKAGKIPSNMLVNYRKECQKIKQEFLPGITMMDEIFDGFL